MIPKEIIENLEIISALLSIWDLSPNEKAELSLRQEIAKYYAQTEEIPPFLEFKVTELSKRRIRDLRLFMGLE